MKAQRTWSIVAVVVGLFIAYAIGYAVHPAVTEQPVVGSVRYNAHCVKAIRAAQELLTYTGSSKPIDGEATNKLTITFNTESVLCY
jgi:hypothetical protein